MTVAASSSLVICHECDSLYRRKPLRPGETARCRRCGAVLYRSSRLSADHLLALVVAALITLVIANLTPIVNLMVQGIANSATLFGSIVALWRDGREIVASLAFATTLGFPALELASLLIVLLTIRRNPDAAVVAVLLRGVQAVRPWGMIEVFMLGVLVALVKLSHMADVIPGVALWAFAALTVLLTTIITFDLRGLWDCRDSGADAAESDEPEGILIGCHACGQVSHDTGDPHARCPRCDAPLHRRKSNSLNRTWALLSAAIILYVPANLLPVMQTSTLFSSQADTIMSGIVYFWKTGSPDLAALIFFVSILVPLAKIASMALLALSIHLASPRALRQRARLYRIVEFIGRWSMLDIFVVTLMVGLVQFRSLAVIDAGPGAAAFGAVVVLTMLASHSFDPRLIWDSAETDK